MSQESVLARMEKWANELNIKNLTWHELTLLRSFGTWLDLNAVEQTDADGTLVGDRLNSKDVENDRPKACDCKKPYPMIDENGKLYCEMCLGRLSS